MKALFWAYGPTASIRFYCALPLRFCSFGHSVSLLASLLALRSVCSDPDITLKHVRDEWSAAGVRAYVIDRSVCFQYTIQ